MIKGTVITCSVLVGPEGGEDSVDIDICVSGDVKDDGTVDNLRAYSPDAVYGDLEFELTDDEYDKAVEALRQAQ